jgi:hypothetical protein
MSTRGKFLDGKGGRCLGLTTLSPLYAEFSEILNIMEPCNLVQTCNGIALNLPLLDLHKVCKLLYIILLWYEKEQSILRNIRGLHLDASLMILTHD